MFCERLYTWKQRQAQHECKGFQTVKDKVSAKRDMLKRHLYRAGHRAEGEHSSTVLYGGLAVKRPLSVNEENGNLQTATRVRLRFVKTP